MDAIDRNIMYMLYSGVPVQECVRFLREKERYLSLLDAYNVVMKLKRSIPRQNTSYAQACYDDGYRHGRRGDHSREHHTWASYLGFIHGLQEHDSNSKRHRDILDLSE